MFFRVDKRTQGGWVFVILTKCPLTGLLLAAQGIERPPLSLVLKTEAAGNLLLSSDLKTEAA